jgi:hypothetical protein
MSEAPDIADQLSAALDLEIERGLSTLWQGEELLIRAGEVAQTIEERVQGVLAGPFRLIQSSRLAS